MKTVNTIMGDFTQEKTKQLRGAYDQAVKDKTKSFTFDGAVFVVEFTKFLLEYLESQFKPNGK